MAADADKIVVAGSGTIYASPTSGVTLTAPTAIDDAVDSDLKELGYVTEDGITFQDSKDVSEIRAWQAAYPVRRIVTGRTFTVSFNLMEWKPETFKLAFGGGTLTETTANTEFKFAPPAEDDLYEAAVLIDFNDGTKDYRLWIPRCTVVELGEIVLKRGEAATLPITLEAISDGTADAWQLFTDDTTFDV